MKNKLKNLESKEWVRNYLNFFFFFLYFCLFYLFFPLSKTARALYDFEGKDEGDLSFKAGDIIEVTSRDEEWWEGR